jgi:hypothetical protein
MNEIALIRAQWAAEKSRLIAVAEACLLGLERGAGKTADEFRSACGDYIESVLTAFEARDRRLADLVPAQAKTDEASHQAFGRALAQPGRSHEALERLQSARAARAPALQAWNASVQYLVNVWGARRDALDALLAANSRVSDWRTIGGIDADSILAERRAYGRVCALLPAGFMLPPAAAIQGQAR